MLCLSCAFHTSWQVPLLHMWVVSLVQTTTSHQHIQLWSFLGHMHASKGHIWIEHSQSIGYGTTMYGTIPIWLAWCHIGPSWGTRPCLNLWEHHLGATNRSPLWGHYSSMLWLHQVDVSQGCGQLHMQDMRRGCHGLVWVSKCASSPLPTSVYPFMTSLTFFLVTSPSDPTFSANTRWPSWTCMSMGHSTSTKTPFHHKLLYSSVIAVTHSSTLTHPIASQYEWGTSTSGNNVQSSLSSESS